MSAVLAWRRERLPLLLFGMLSVYLGLAASVVNATFQAGTLLVFAMQVLAAWCLVASFRILDDIADLPRDAVRTPDRVLVGVSNLWPFRFAAVGLLAMGSLILLVLTGWFGPVLVIGLAVSFGEFYRAGLGHREYWVLLKYPLFVIAMGAEHWTTPLLVYLCFSIYERIQDSALRERPGALLILIVHLLGVGFVTAMAVNDSWWLWLLSWSAVTALSVLAHTRKWPAFAPAFLVFSIFVFQGTDASNLQSINAGLEGGLTSLQQSVWLCLPLILGGITHVAMIKSNALPSLARLRLDCGLKLRGRDLFGANKTVRGAVVMISATIFWTIVLDGLQAALNLGADLRYIPMDQLGSVSLGFLLGSAYIVGELPNSLVKRQLNINPGSAASGPQKKLFWLVDQVDSALAVLIVLCFVRRPNLEVYLYVMVFTVVLHPIIAALMVALGLKRRVG